jgi:hypothetical protein
MRNAHEIMVIKSEGKRPFGKTRHRWKNVITFYIREIECEAADWTQLNQVTEWSSVSYPTSVVPFSM